MESIMQLLSFGRKGEAGMCARVEQALHSLRARGLVETFQHFEPATFRLQWDRGNFGFELMALRAGRGWNLEFAPLCMPAGPFAASAIGSEVVPLPGWVRCGPAGVLERVDRMAHIALVDWLRRLETGHPAADWLAGQFLRMAKGERPRADELQGMVMLGARRFVKTIPGSDRLHEAIEPALLTLLRMNAGNARAGSEDEVIAGEDYGRALIGFLQETHPLEAKRAAHRHAAAR
ncbi:MAG TPA: hypothetical protein VF254_01440 [Gammaproteobacteria bacterium]